MSYPVFPPVYHVIYICCAVHGRRGFKLFYLPYFEKWHLLRHYIATTFLCSLKMNCILLCEPKIYYNVFHVVFFLVIVMTTNLTTQCLEYVSTKMNWHCMDIWKRRRLVLPVFSCVNNDCEITIKFLYILTGFLYLKKKKPFLATSFELRWSKPCRSAQWTAQFRNNLWQGVWKAHYRCKFAFRVVLKSSTAQVDYCAYTVTCQNIYQMCVNIFFQL